MKAGKIAFRIGAVMLTLVLGAVAIWWRVDAKNRKENPWAYSEYHARIVAEGRTNGDVIKLKGEDGKTYYLVMPGSKSGMIVKPEDISAMALDIWRSNRDKPLEERSQGTRHAQRILDYSDMWMWGGGVLNVDVSIEHVKPGTTVEELMAQEELDGGNQP